MEFIKVLILIALAVFHYLEKNRDFVYIMLWLYVIVDILNPNGGLIEQNLATEIKL